MSVRYSKTLSLTQEDQEKMGRVPKDCTIVSIFRRGLDEVLKEAQGNECKSKKQRGVRSTD